MARGAAATPGPSFQPFPFPASPSQRPLPSTLTATLRVEEEVREEVLVSGGHWAPSDCETGSASATRTQNCNIHGLSCPVLVATSTQCNATRPVGLEGLCNCWFLPSKKRFQGTNPVMIFVALEADPLSIGGSDCPSPAVGRSARLCSSPLAHHMSVCCQGMYSSWVWAGG